MRALSQYLSGLTIAVAIGFTVGCETESASDNDVRITPPVAALRLNQAQTFTASGGYEYTWSLSDESLGTLTTKQGPTTTYINRSDPGIGNAPLRLTLTVTSNPRPDAVGTGTTTNAGSFVKSAQAVIELLPTEAVASGTAP